MLMKLKNTARLSDSGDYIIDSDNNRIELNDPRVVFIWPIETSTATTELLKVAFEKQGFRFRSLKKTSVAKTEYAKNICSGKECFSCLSMAGETYRDIVTNRSENEISLYYNFNSTSSCQSGAWPVMWDVVSAKLNLKNTIFMTHANMENNYFGKGSRFALSMVNAVILGDILEEAELSLKCLAIDKTAAMETLETENKKIIESTRKGRTEIKKALASWAKKMAKIPLKSTITSTPRVLIFGGMGIMFVQEEITNYFIAKGILPKIEEASLGVRFVEGRRVLRHGLKRGYTSPDKQFNLKGIVSSLIDSQLEFKESFKAFRSRLNIYMIEFTIKQFRKTALKSGLLFDSPISFTNIVNTGNTMTSYSIDSETPFVSGLFSEAIKSKTYDGYVNAGYFSCLPGMSAQHINKKIAAEMQVPFAAIDFDGIGVSENQYRLLETVYIQANRSSRKSE